MIRQFIKFGVVGALNTVIDFGLLNLLVQVFGWPVVWANAVSFSVAVINSYLLNKRWTFRNQSRAHVRQFSMFGLVSVVGLLLSSVLVHYGTEVLGAHSFGLAFAWQYNVAKAVSVVVVLLWNFFASKYLVFNDIQH